MALEIIQEGHPTLRQVAKDVPEELFGTEELRTIIRDMEEALDGQADGVALAAPQVNIPYRIFIVRYDRMVERSERGPSTPERGVYINPVITKSSRKRAECDEGCLSVRGVYGKTDRHEQATVRARDIEGNVFERGGGGILAQAFQHEIDHLNGILFIDHAHDLHAMARDIEHAPFVYFGTPYVSSDTLEILRLRGITPALIVTSPDAPQGRGMKLTPSPTKQWAEENDIPVIAPEELDEDAIKEIQAVGAEYGIAVAFGKILPRELISSFPKGVLNIHYSLLPKYRGASPVEGALLAGETMTGVTIQKMVYELDEGDVLAAKEVEIGPTETTRELRARLILEGANLLADMLPSFENDELEAVPQDHAQATYSGKISKEDGLLDLNGDAKENWNKYRAYAESPGTYFFVERNGKKMRVKIKSATFENGTFMPLRIVPEGKKETNYEDFSRVSS